MSSTLIGRMRIKARCAISRCYSSRADKYEYYGGRGIRVHAPWLADLQQFAEYLAALPGAEDASLRLDRKDVNGHYEPGNLQFVTRSESTRNQRHAQSRPRRVPMVLQQLRDEIAARHLELRANRKAAGFSQRMLAAKAGVVHHYIRAVERGEPFGSKDSLRRILAAYEGL